MNKVAVAILNYNGESYIKQFLPSLLEHTINAPIYVIDNCSTDSSLDILENEFPTVQVIQLRRNLGYAGGYNAGVMSIDAEYIAMVNSDIEVTKDWLDPLLFFLDGNKDCVAVQPKIKSYHNKELFEYAGAAGGFLDGFGYPYCRGRIFEHIEKDEGQYDKQTEVFWTSGACFVIRKLPFEDIGGFDVDFFAHMEEIDLCWRLKRSNWKLFCISESTVYHVGGGTLSSLNPRKTFLNFRNGLFLLVKNLTRAEYYKLFLRIVLDWVAALKFTLEGSPSHSIAVLKAHGAFFKLFNREYRKRSGSYYVLKSIQAKPLRSIVWQRFVGRMRKFSDLHQ